VGQLPGARRSSLLLSSRGSQSQIQAQLYGENRPVNKGPQQCWVDLDFSQRDGRRARIAQKLTEVKSRGCCSYNEETGRAVIMKEMKFKPRHYGAWMADAPTAEFAEAHIVKGIAMDLVELHHCFPGPTLLVFWRREQAAAMGFKAEHEQWLATLAQNKAEKIRQLLVQSGVPQTQLTLRVVTMKPDPNGDGSGKCGVYVEFDKYAENDRLAQLEQDRTKRVREIVNGPSKGVVDYDFSNNRIYVLIDLAFKTRRYCASSMEPPTAEQRDQHAINDVLIPIADILKLHEVPACLNMVCREPPPDESSVQYKEWLKALFWNRADFLRRNLCHFGVPNDMLSMQTVTKDGEVCGPPLTKWIDPRSHGHSHSHDFGATMPQSPDWNSNSNSHVFNGHSHGGDGPGGSSCPSPLLTSYCREGHHHGAANMVPMSGPISTGFASVRKSPSTSGFREPRDLASTGSTTASVPGVVRGRGGRGETPPPRSVSQGRSPSPPPSPMPTGPSRRPPSSTPPSQFKLQRPGGPRQGKMAALDECKSPIMEKTILSDGSVADVEAPSPALEQAREAVLISKKMQAKKDLEQLVFITKVEEMPLLEEAVENARKAGLQENRVDPLFSQAEDTLERLRKIKQRRSAWVRHGEREASMKHIRPAYVVLADNTW